MAYSQSFQTTSLTPLVVTIDTTSNTFILSILSLEIEEYLNILLSLIVVALGLVVQVFRSIDVATGGT